MAGSLTFWSARSAASSYIRSAGSRNWGNRIASTLLPRITWPSFTISGGSAATSPIVIAQSVRRYAQGLRVIFACGVIAWDMPCVVVRGISVILDLWGSSSLSLRRSNAVVSTSPPMRSDRWRNCRFRWRIRLQAVRTMTQRRIIRSASTQTQANILWWCWSIRSQEDRLATISSKLSIGSWTRFKSSPS